MGKVFDASRKRLVAETPEESVRQGVVRWLKDSLRVPPHLIETELSLSLVKKGFPGRVDILVHDFREGAPLKNPWLLVECKRPGVESAAALQVQINRYLKVLTPKFIMLALGDKSLFLALDSAKKSYRPVSSLPEFPQPKPGKIP